MDAQLEAITPRTMDDGAAAHMVSVSETAPISSARRFGRSWRCGRAALETIPARPSPGSPPGLYAVLDSPGSADVRALNRTQGAVTDAAAWAVIENEPGPLWPRIRAVGSGRRRRSGGTPMEMVPGTSWVQLQSARKTQTCAITSHEACRTPPMTPPPSASPAALTVSPCGMTPPALGVAKKRATREALVLRTKQFASLLQVEAENKFQHASVTNCTQKAWSTLCFDFDESGQTTDVGHGSNTEPENSSESSGAEEPCLLRARSLEMPYSTSATAC